MINVLILLYTVVEVYNQIACTDKYILLKIYLDGKNEKLDKYKLLNHFYLKLYY